MLGSRRSALLCTDVSTMQCSDQSTQCRRSRIISHELHYIARQYKQEQWAHPEAWPDFMARLELLSASEGYAVHVHDFDPSGQSLVLCFSSSSG